MKNSKLTLNKATVANLSSDEMLNTIGGAGYESSRKSCCDSRADDPNNSNQSSKKNCCNCAATSQTPSPIGTGG